MTKKILTILVLMLIGLVGFAQQKPKPKDKPPTQKEIDEMMREAQKEMEGLSEEEKKMMEEMGVKMPDLKNIPKFTDEQIQEVADQEGQFIPKKDASRISLANRKVGTVAQVKTHSEDILVKMKRNYDAEFIKSGESLYNSISAKNPNTNAVEVTGIGLWTIGKSDMALYLLTRAAIDHPEDPNTINNFAALLNMRGYEEYALPVLKNLNSRYPKNYIIQNNLAHAWLGLGDVAMAQKNLDTALMLYPGNPQANFTKALIEESKGNKKGAIDALKKSISKSYSSEKRSQLSKLGYELKDSDVNWTIPRPADALGLEQFKLPPYPKNIEESEALKPAWEDFKNQINKELAALSAKRGQAEKGIEDVIQKRMQLQLAGKMPLAPWYADKATIKFLHLVSEDPNGGSFQLVKSKEKLERASEQIIERENQRSQEFAQKLGKECEFGEGSTAAQRKACCDKTDAINNAYLADVNGIAEQAYHNYMSHMRRRINDETYYKQYMMWPEEFEGQKIMAKEMWLTVLRDADPIFVGPCMEKSKVAGKTTGPLQDFYDLNCNNIVSFGIPGVMESVWRCNINTVTIDLKIPFATPIGIKSKVVFDTDNNTHKGTLEVGTSIGTGLKKQVGPIKAEVKIETAAGIEFTEKGLSDAYVTATAEIKIGSEFKIYPKNADGTDPKGASIGVSTGGVKGTYSIMNGASMDLAGSKGPKLSL